jgi:hypothetical protein
MLVVGVVLVGVVVGAVVVVGVVVSAGTNADLVYPALIAHVKEPSLSVHAAWSSQLSSVRAHSSMLLHATPLPVQPTLHEHNRNDPALLAHSAFTLQLSRSAVHPVTSAHVTPLPV